MHAPKVKKKTILHLEDLDQVLPFHNIHHLIGADIWGGLTYRFRHFHLFSLKDTEYFTDVYWR